METIVDFALRWIWFLIGPALIAIGLLVRRTFRQLGLELTTGFLWLFSRRIRATVATTVNRRRYCKLALNAPGTEALLVPSEHGSISVKTDEVFVSLRLFQRSNINEEVTDATLLTVAQRVRIIGDPGSGKSSLVKRTFRELCRAGQANARGARIPVLVELRAIRPPAKSSASIERDDWLFDHVKQRVEKTEGHKMDEFFDLCVRQSGVVVFLDGLDEVSSSAYSRMLAAIRALSNRLARHGARNLIVLTLRTQFYHQTHEDLDDAFPTTLQVQPFNTSDMYEFLTNWFAGASGRTSRDAIMTEFDDRPSLRDMCSNPLILAMYAANFGDTTLDELPDTRTEFYRAVVEELLVRRRSRQTSNRIGRIARREQRYSLLGRVAFDNLMDATQSANSLSWSYAIQTVQELLNVNEERAKSAFLSLGNETGIFSIERKEESFRFIHLTFCEYFAAVEAATNRENGWAELVGYHQQGDAARLNEVFPFAIALVLRGRRQVCLNDVFALNDMSLYARCVLETQAYEHPKWTEYELKERAYLVEASTEEWTQTWLARLRLYQVTTTEARLLRAESGRLETDQEVVTSDLYTELVARSKERLIFLFSSYATERPRAAFALAESCGLDLVAEAPELLTEQCASPQFLSICIQRAVIDGPEGWVSWAPILATAGMRHRIAAKVLVAEPAPGFDEGMSRSRRSFDWRIIPGIGSSKPSLYGCALSAALSNQFEASEEIQALRPIRAPGRLRPRLLLLCLSIFGFLVSVGIYMGSSKFIFPRGDWVAISATFFAAFASAFALMFGITGLFYAIYRPKVYRWIANLDDSALQSGLPAGLPLFARLSLRGFGGLPFVPRSLRERYGLNSQMGHLIALRRRSAILTS